MKSPSENEGITEGMNVRRLCYQQETSPSRARTINHSLMQTHWKQSLEAKLAD
jgi:hypothetical protein